MNTGTLQRSVLLGLSVLAAIAFMLGAANVRAADTDRRPNVLFCLADDWGWPHAGVYGDRVVQTPAFDRLAREGVLFDRAFISSPSCTPCRNSIITGQHFYRLDQGANLHSTLDVRHPNFMTLLEAAGYAIGHYRKAWGPGDFRAGGYERNPCGPPFKGFADFMKQRPKNQPFCFWFGTSDPHRPYVEGSGRESGIDVDAVQVPAYWPNVETVRSDIADYYFEVQRWDRDVADAMALLEEAGQLDNTIIVMSGDHGMPFPRCKGNLYDWGVRVPLAIRWGGQVKAGQRVNDFVSLIDIAPTVLEAAGVKVPAVMTGRSLLDLLRGKESKADRGSIVMGRERHTPAQEVPSMVGYPARAIRTDRWLYIMNLESDRWPAGVPENATHPIGQFADCDGGPTKAFLMEHQSDPKYTRYFEYCFAKRPAEELYDCENDPYQLKNFATDPEHGATVEQLRSKLIARLRETADPRFADVPVKFDEYPYRTSYIKKRLDEWRDANK